jgi:hypothetical protein
MVLSNSTQRTPVRAVSSTVHSASRACSMRTASCALLVLGLPGIEYPYLCRVDELECAVWIEAALAGADGAGAGDLVVVVGGLYFCIAGATISRQGPSQLSKRGTSISHQSHIDSYHRGSVRVRQTQTSQLFFNGNSETIHAGL